MGILNIMKKNWYWKFLRKRLLKNIARKKNPFSHQLKKDRLLKEKLFISFEIIFVIYMLTYIYFTVCLKWQI